jgi:hypothetical protein
LLRAIAYLSSASRTLKQEDLDFIVAESRRLNAASGVTGVLLYCDGNFMQYFEGDAAAVATTYTRVLASTRHHCVSELMNEPIAEREFAQWSLGFAQATPDGFMESTWGHLQEDPDCGPGAALLKTFWSVCR